MRRACYYRLSYALKMHSFTEWWAHKVFWTVNLQPYISLYFLFTNRVECAKPSFNCKEKKFEICMNSLKSVALIAFCWVSKISQCQRLSIIIQTIYRSLPTRFYFLSLKFHFNMIPMFDVRSNKQYVLEQIYWNLFFGNSKTELVSSSATCPMIVNNYEVKCWPITNSFECNIVDDSVR